MIINVGARTDIVHRFTPWLLNRLREGFVITRNPLFPNRVTRYELTPDKVDAILFCSKNYEPILPYMAEIARDYRIYCYYTITAYGEDIEPNVPDIDTSIEMLGELSSIVGKGKADAEIHRRAASRDLCRYGGAARRFGGPLYFQLCGGL